MENLNSFQILIFTEMKSECTYMCSMNLNNTPYNLQGDCKHKHIAKGKPNVHHSGDTVQFSKYTNICSDALNYMFFFSQFWLGLVNTQMVVMM